MPRSACPLLITGAFLLSALLHNTNASAITRCEVLRRGQAWVDDPSAMYSWNATYTDPATGVCCYRPDCSGLVSAVWGLPPPGHTTYSFAGGPWDDGVSYTISASDLKPGDALNYPGNPNAGTGHIMLYVSGNFASGNVEVMEEYNYGHSAERRWRNIDTSIYRPIRYKNISDGDPEVCNGKDDDCDGQIDEGGVCCKPSPEVCDGIDNDCNGKVDDSNVCGTGPNGCINQAGDFGFNCAGTLPAMTCTSVAEGADPDGWTDNYFCSKLNLGMKWSSSGPIAGMTCTEVNEGAEPAAHTWTDNYLCVLPGAPYTLSWSSAGPGKGECVRWQEPSDKHTWTDNFMCATRTDPNACVWRHAGFGFSCAGPIVGMSCVQLAVPEDPDGWKDNYFCSDTDIGMKWSSKGPIPGMKCTQVTESSEPAAEGWSDNYICLPKGAPYDLKWSSSGPLATGGCVGWIETADLKHTWSDNFLCSTSTDPAACIWNEGGYAFSCNGPVKGMNCVKVDEPADNHGWSDNYFCSAKNVGLTWSNQGPVAGKTCVQITESAEGKNEGWTNNYLCIDKSAPIKLTWSSTGRPKTGTCIRWYEPSDTKQSWTDNWLCLSPYEVCNDLDDDGNGKIDDGVCGDAGAWPPVDAGSVDSGEAPSEDASVAKPDGSASTDAATKTDGTSLPDIASSDSDGGCAVRSDGSTSAKPWLFMSLMLSIALLRRKRSS